MRLCQASKEEGASTRFNIVGWSLLPLEAQSIRRNLNEDIVSASGNRGLTCVEQLMDGTLMALGN